MSIRALPAAFAALLTLSTSAFAEGAAAPTPSNEPPAISVVEASVRQVTETVTVTGTLVAREEVQVSADIDGLKIEDILVDAGDSVKAGDVLARLSTDTIDVQLAQNDSQAARSDAAIAQADSQIVAAQATLDEAEAALRRTKTLADKGVVSQDVLDQRVSAASTAKAQLAIAKQGLSVAEADKTLVAAQRREIELRKEKTEIKAPTDGLVLEKNARIGAVASSQSGPLFRMARNGLVELDAEVIETDLAKIETGQAVTVDAAGHGKVEGKVRLVSPEVDSATRLGHVRVAFDEGQPVRIGSFARGAIEVASREGVTVPVSAVVTSGDSATVQVVKDAVVETRTVKTGLSNGGVVEIVEGLEAGETVVGRAGTFLRDGDRISPVAKTGEETEG